MQRQRWFFGGALAGFLVLLAPVSGYAEEAPEKPGRTVMSGIPWSPTPPSPQPKVIYGDDDRIDLYQETDPDRRAWAAATCGLFTSGNVVENGDGTFTIQTSAYNVCPDEPFASQPTAAFCSGFMVGEDIIATAGHCFDSGDLNGVRFVFGFVMEDPNTPVLTVDASQVYTGVELLGRALSGGLDYAVVRVDRAITSPGAVPFELRRTGVIGEGENVGVIGHPSGLPLKIAFGDNTVVRDNSSSGFFVANLDTYGGNSGSPVIHPETGILEGILVRGETDFVSDGGCLRSNMVSDTGGRGEDVSKSTTFMQFVPELGSSLRLDREAYTCDATMEISVTDQDMAGTGTASVLVVTSGGDEESFALAESGSTGEFFGSVALADADPVPGNGNVEIAPGETITASYMDVVHAPGEPDELVETAAVDCIAPVVSGFGLVQANSRTASVAFSTDEETTGVVRFGADCENPTGQSSFLSGASHVVSLQDLEPATTYHWFVEASDAAGNLSVGDDGGTCFTFTTAESTSYYTERFASVNPDLNARAVTFSPVPGSGGFSTCVESITSLPESTAGANPVALSDDDAFLLSLADGAEFTYFGVPYSSLFINSNGSITFGAGSTAFQPELSTHFETPRISALFTDLNPSAGGIVSHQQFADRLVVTWLDVPHYTLGGSNRVQVTLFFDGTIRFAYTRINARPAIVGLSNGQGLQQDFEADDLSAAGSCSVVTYHSADTNENGAIEVQELMRVIQFLNLDGYHCDASGEDGYGAGPGVEGCDSHDSDYNPQDWQINLTEILRLVQFYNAGAYSESPGSEDGFQPVLKSRD